MKSYKDFLDDLRNFKRAGTLNGDEFNLYDTPAHKYFRIFFHFYNGDATGTDNPMYSGGLLAPTWEYTEDWHEIWKYNSAYSYLIMNNELERADLLKKFIELLSNISTKSPWYFANLSGIAEALERKQIHEPEFKIEEQRKKLSIKCLPDAYDDRIGTLLDLYRAIVWSWQTKREIVPSNLRKFDMSVYIFESPIANIHKQIRNTSLFNQRQAVGDSYATIDSKNTNHYITSHKYIEFHNCEIDYNSVKTGYPEMTQEGFAQEYTIDIYFDDCYETRYNEFIAQSIGDMVMWDIDNTSSYTVDTSEQNKRLSELESRSNVYKSNFLTELGGAGARFVNETINKIKLGNLYSFSLSDIKDQIQLAKEGHLFSTIGSARTYIENDKKAKLEYVKQIGNLFKAQSTLSNL